MNLLAIAMREGPISLYAGVVLLLCQIPMPDLDQRGWLRIAFVVVFLLATALSLLILAQRQRKRQRRTCRLEIANLGNVPSCYELQAEDPAGGVRFTFVLGKTRLRQTVEPVTIPAVPAPSAGPTADTGKARQTEGVMRTGGLVADVLYTLGSLLPRSLGAPLTRTAGQIRRGQTQVRRVERLQDQASRLQPTRPSSGQENASVPPSVGRAAVPAAAGPTEARQPGEGAMRTGGLLADTLYTLGSLLPRSLGAPLTRTASQIRQGQTQVRRVEQLQGQVSRLQPTRPSPGPVSTSGPSSAGQAVARPGETVVPASAAPATDAPPGTPGWVQTPAVEPGGTLVLALLVDPVDPFQTQHYPFVVRSRSLEQPEASPVVQEGSVQIVKPTLVQRFGPYLAVLGIAAIVFVVVVIQS